MYALPRLTACFVVLFLFCLPARAAAQHPQAILSTVIRCLQKGEMNGYLQLFPDAGTAIAIATQSSGTKRPSSDPLFADTAAFSKRYRTAGIGNFLSNHFHSNFIGADWRNIKILKSRFEADTPVVRDRTLWIVDMPQTVHTAHILARNTRTGQDYNITIRILIVGGKWLSGIDLSSFEEIKQPHPVTRDDDFPGQRTVKPPVAPTDGYDYVFAGLRGRDSVWLTMEYRRKNGGDFSRTRVSYHTAKDRNKEVVISEGYSNEATVHRYHDATRGEDWWFVFNETLSCYIVSDDLKFVKAIIRLNKLH